MRERTPKELRQARKLAGFSMKSAADFARVPYRTWQNWESEDSNFRRPPEIAFVLLELYRKLNEHGLLPKEADDERKAA